VARSAVYEPVWGNQIEAFCLAPLPFLGFQAEVCREGAGG